MLFLPVIKSGFMQVMEMLKSQNIQFQFSSLESHGMEVRFMENHGKAICLLRIKRQKDEKLEK